nr:hypothetical protein CFP56_03224 [Quercus suber]
MSETVDELPVPERLDTVYKFLRILTLAVLANLATDLYLATNSLPLKVPKSTTRTPIVIYSSTHQLSGSRMDLSICFPSVDSCLFPNASYCNVGHGSEMGSRVPCKMHGSHVFPKPQSDPTMRRSCAPSLRRFCFSIVAETGCALHDASSAPIDWPVLTYLATLFLIKLEMSLQSGRL